MQHYVDFEKIESFKYVTIKLDSIISEDPKKVIEYITKIKEEQGIDYIKVVFNVPMQNSNRVILSNYYRSHDDVSLEFMSTQEEQLRKAEEETQMDRFNFILDHNLSDEQIFVMYVNENEGYEFITVDGLKDILSSD